MANSDIRIKLSADGTQVKNELRLIDKELQELGKSNNPATSSNTTTSNTQNPNQSRQSSTDRTNQNIQLRAQNLLIRELKSLRQEVTKLNDTYVKNNNTNGSPSSNNNNNGGGNNSNPPSNNNNNSGGGNNNNNRNDNTSGSTRTRMDDFNIQVNKLQSVLKNIHNAYEKVRSLEASASLDLQRQRMAYSTYGTVSSENNYSRLSRMATSQGREYGYNYQQYLPAAGALIQRSGYNEATHTQDMNAVMSAARGTGLDPTQIANFAGRATASGTYKQGELQKFANMIGTSIADNGMQGRESEQVKVLESIHSTLAAKNVGVSEKTFASGLALSNALAQSNPALKGERGAALTDKLINGGYNDTALYQLAGWTGGAKERRELRKMQEQDPVSFIERVVNNGLKMGSLGGWAGEDTELYIKEMLDSSLHTYTGESDALIKMIKENNGKVPREIRKDIGDTLLQRNVDRYKDSTLWNPTQTQYSMREGEARFSAMGSSALGVVPDAGAEALGMSSGLTGAISGVAGSGLLTLAMSRYLGSAGGGRGIGGLGGILRGARALGRMGASTLSTVGSGLLGKGLGLAGGALGAYGAYESAKEGNTLSAALEGGLSGASIGATIGSIIPGVGTAVGAGVGGVLGLAAGGIGSLVMGKESGVAHAATAPQDKTLSSTLVQDETKARDEKTYRSTEANTQALIDNTNALRGNKNTTKMVDDNTSAKKSQEDEKKKTISDILRGVTARGASTNISSSGISYTGSMGSGSMVKAVTAPSKGSGNYNMSGGAVDTSGILDRDITQDSGVTADTLNKLFANGIMKGMGQDFIDIGHEYGIDPAFLAAITKAENNYGSDLSGILGKQGSKHNVMSILDANHLPETYDMGSIQGNVREMAKQLRKYYVEGAQNGYDERRTARTIQEVYCPDGVEGGGHWRNAIPTAYEDMVRIQGGLPGTKAKSHAQGLEYVPRDDYPAQLHKGERVLTKHEAEEFRNLPGLIDVPDSMKITKDDGLYDAKMKHQLQKDYREESATTSSDPYFNAPRFDQGGTIGGATSKTKRTKNLVVLNTGQIVDKSKWEAGEYPGTKIASKYGEGKQYSSYKEYSDDIDKLSKLSNKRDQNIVNNPNATSEQSSSIQKESNLIQKDWEKEQPKTDKEWDEYEAYHNKTFGKYKREREKGWKNTSSVKKESKNTQNIQKPQNIQSYIPQPGTVERVNPDGTTTPISQSPNSSQAGRPSREQAFGVVGGGFAGGNAPRPQQGGLQVQQQDNGMISIGFQVGMGYQGDPERIARQQAFQQYVQKKSDQSRFNPANNDPLVGAINGAINAPWSQASGGFIPRVNGKAMGHQIQQGMKLSKRDIIPRISKKDFFRKTPDGNGYMINPFGVQAGMQRFNQQRQQRAYQAMTGMSPQGVGMQGGRPGVTVGQQRMMGGRPGQGGSQAQQLLAYSQSRGIGGALQGQGGSPNMQGGFSMNGQVRTQQGGNAQLVDPNDINRATAAGVMGLGGAVISGFGNLFESIGGLFGGSKKDKNKPPKKNFLQKTGGTLTDNARKERAKMNTLKGDGTSLDTKVPLPTEPSKLGTKVPEKDGLDEIKPIKKDKTGKHRGLIGRWRNTAEEHNGAMNSLFAGTANAVETIGNGIGGIFGGLFGGKKKKNPDAPDLTAGVSGKDILSGLNKETSASAALGDTSSKTEKTEVSGNAKVTVQIEQDGKPPKEVETMVALTSTQTIGSSFNKNHGFSRSFLNTGAGNSGISGEG